MKPIAFNSFVTGAVSYFGASNTNLSEFVIYTIFYRVSDPMLLPGVL